MPITLNESGNLGFYWYKSKSERFYKTDAYVGNCSLFGYPNPPSDDPADNCKLCFTTEEFDPEKQNKKTIIAQGPEWVEYVCEPACTPDAPPVCICCVGPNYIHQVKTPDVESESMFHMLWDTSDHGRWCRTGNGYCPDGKMPLTITNTEIETDAKDDEIHIVGTNGNSITNTAICIRYVGGTPDPFLEERQHLREGDTLGGATIETIYHYSKWNNVEDQSKDLNYHYVELSTPLVGQTYLASLPNSMGANVQIVAGGGIPDKAIVFGRFEFIKKKIYYTKLRTNPSLYTQTADREIIDEYPVTQRTTSKIKKAKPGKKLKKFLEGLQSDMTITPELSEYTGQLLDAATVEVDSVQEIERNEEVERNKQERYLKIYEEDGVYSNNSEGNEGRIESARIGISVSASGVLSDLTITNPGAGYGDQLEVNIDSPTGRDAVGLLVGSAPLDSITVDVEGEGYQLNPPATITPNYTEWTANSSITVNEMYVYNSNLYQALGNGVFSTTPPTHTSGIAEYNGTKLRYTGTLPTFSTNLIGTTRTEYINITKQGSGYTSVPPITFNTGTQTAVATLDGDRITAITVTPGDGATSNPLITIGNAWVGNEPYNIGDQVFLGPNLYEAAATGTSGTTAPTHTSGTASDGNLDWTWVGEAAKAVSTNYDGRITEVTVVNPGGSTSQSTDFDVSLPTSPYTAGTQLQITPVRGDFTFTDAVLLNSGSGYRSDNTTVTVGAVTGTTVQAEVDVVFSEADTSVIRVGDDFVNSTNDVRGSISEVSSGGTVIKSRDIDAQLTVGDTLYISNRKIYVNVSSYTAEYAPRTLDRIDHTLHERMTAKQVSSYDEGQNERLIPEKEGVVKTEDEYGVFGGDDGNEGNSWLDRITGGNFAEAGGFENSQTLNSQETEYDEFIENQNLDELNSTKIAVLGNTKVKKYGPIKRWRDLPRSTTELKIMPTKWVPDKREQVNRTFTITMKFEGSCDTGTVIGSPCGSPCCPPVPNTDVSFSYTKYFVNNFSNAASRWVNIIKTYNDHPSNANWSFL